MVKQADLRLGQPERYRWMCDQVVWDHQRSELARDVKGLALGSLPDLLSSRETLRWKLLPKPG